MFNTAGFIDYISPNPNPAKPVTKKEIQKKSLESQRARAYRIYYGDLYPEVQRHKRIYESELSRNFFHKYPSADIKKFDFEVLFKPDGSVDSKTIWFLVDKEKTNRYDITGDGFKSNPRFTEFLYWPRGWKVNPTSLPLVVKENPLRLNLNKLLIFVTEKEHFNVALAPVNTSNRNTDQDIRKTNFDYINDPWFTRLAGSYVCSYLCGISQEHIENLFPRAKSNIITAVVRYHFALWIRRFLAKPELLAKYLTPEVVKDIQSHIPVTEKWDTKFSDSQAKLSIFRAQMKGKTIRNARLVVSGNQGVSTRYEEFAYRHAKNNIQDFILGRSVGLTKLGSEMFQESLESYIYCILGSQARTRWSITGQGAKSYQTQEVFRKLFQDQVVLVDTTSEIGDMRTAIKSTNIRLDFAISPGMILCSSDLRLNGEIRGFNNVLTVASKFMSFGGNSGVNQEKSVLGVEDDSDKKEEKDPQLQPQLQRKSPKKIPKPPLRPVTFTGFGTNTPAAAAAAAFDSATQSYELPLIFSAVAGSTWIISKIIIGLI